MSLQVVATGLFTHANFLVQRSEDGMNYVHWFMTTMALWLFSMLIVIVGWSGMIQVCLLY